MQTNVFLANYSSRVFQSAQIFILKQKDLSYLETFGKAFEDIVHVDSVRVRPSVLKVLFETLTQRVRYLMKTNELFHVHHLRVIPSRATVQALNDRAHIAEDRRVHESYGKVRISLMTSVFQ